MNPKSSSGVTKKQISLTRHSSSYWRVTFDIAPLNIFGPANVPELSEIVTAIETDVDVKVVVFNSAVEGFFLTHYDFLAKPEESPGCRSDVPACKPSPTC